MSERIAHPFSTVPQANAQAQQVRNAVQRAASHTGVDFSYLIATAQRESALNPSARAGTSSATGLFQFIDSTWLDMVRKHGAAHGLGGYAAALQSGGVSSDTRADILALRNNPEISARMAGELARENAQALQAQLGRAPNATELYAAHFLGAGGASRLIQAAQNGAPDASALFPREAVANRAIFFKPDGAARSASEVLARLDLDASAHVGAGEPNPSGSFVPESGVSAQMVQALLHVALAPLLRPGERDDGDLSSALLAYQRANANGNKV